jgi:para-nitrobenzyl esterase
MGQFWPVADGTLLRGDEYELYLKGQYNDTPVLLGSNSDEGAFFVHDQVTPAVFEQEVRKHFGACADAMLRLYPHTTEEEAFKSTKDLFRESVFAWPTWAWATLHARNGRNPTYVYYFDHRLPGSPDGSSHATEIGYVFGNLNGWGGGSRPEDQALADLMSACWVNFATTGNPNGPGLPIWPAFNEKNPSAMVFDQTPGARPMPNLEKLKAFDDYFAQQRKQPTVSEMKKSAD